MNSPTESRTRTFAKSLRQAIHDLDHETAFRSGPTTTGKMPPRVVHYWDTDSLFWPAVGFAGEEWRTVNSQRRGSRQSERLIPALYSLGLLGRVHMLAPHRAEFLNLLSAWADHRPSCSYERALTSYSQQNGLQPLLQELTRSVDLLGVESETSIRKSLDVLRRIPTETFIKVESISWPWESRVTRLLDDPGILNLDLGGPPSAKILDSPLFERIVTEVDFIRDDPRRSAATAFDAAAMTSLAILNEEATAGTGAIYPRFYTASTTLRAVYSSKNSGWLRDAYSYTFETKRGKTVSGTIWRGRYYYLLRSLLPALAIPDSLGSTRGGGPRLQELRDLSRMLNDEVETGSESISRLLSGKLSDGRTVHQLIGAVEAGGITMAWLQQEFDPGVVRLVRGVRAIQDLASVDETHELASRFLVSAESALRIGVQELSLQSQLSRQVARAWAGVTRLDGRSAITLLYDLAGVRWGLRPSRMRGVVEMGEPSRNQVKEEARLVARRRTDQRVRDLVLFQDVEELRRSVSLTERAMAILVGLGLFRCALQLANISQGDRVPRKRTVRLMQRYSALRLGEVTDLREFMAMVETDFRRLSPNDKRRYALGYAHIAYWAWKLGRFAGHALPGSADSSQVERFPLDPYSWASWSIEVVQESYSDMSTLQKQYASNHIVRAGFDSCIEPAASVRRHLEYLEDLVAAGAPNYRFYDTVGYQLLLTATREFPALGRFEPSAFARWADTHRTVLHRSIDLLVKARSLAPKDPQVREHLTSAYALYEEAQSVFSAGAFTT